MALSSGLDAQVTIGEETTYGTQAAAITRGFDFNSESIKLLADRIESKALRSGQRVIRQLRRVHNRKGAAGDLELDVCEKGMAVLFKHMLGSVLTTTPGGGTNSRTHTCTIGDLSTRSLTVQVGRPDVSGTVRPFTYLGGKVDSWELSCDFDGILNLKLSMDFQDEVTATGLATAAYPTGGGLLTYAGGTLTLGGSSIDVTKFSLKGDNGLATDRYMIRSSTLKKNPLQANLIGITADIDVEFNTLTDYNRFANGTVAAFTATFVGSIIEGAIPYQVVVTLPAVWVDGETPNVGGADILTHTLSLVATDDGTNPPITIAVQNADTSP